jgi:enoyl-CoA hydratase/carnithine racemase
MGRIITLPVPTVAAVNGHAFGAGFMCALCHDTRMQRADRGFMCANEVDIGMVIPHPELALFRHKLPMNAYVETVMQARRWAGPQALAAGV